MDATEFSERVRACEPKLYHMAKSLLLCEADCADAVQEALLKAWRKLGALRQEEYFETWLTRIVINECKSALRRRARRGESELNESLPAPPPPDPFLWDALTRLPEKYRLTLVLHYLYGYDLNAVARILRLPKTTVKGRLNRARGQLRAMWEKEASV